MTLTSKVNSLTASWLARSEGSGVLSGAGLWPLLAILAASADEPGRSELAAAADIPADEAMDAAREVLDLLSGLVGVEAALGLWAQARAKVREDWLAAVPPNTYGELTGDPSVDQPMLDRWASDRTGGLIEKFPVEAGPQVVLILATALALRTTWIDEFTDGLLVPASGPWADRQLAGLTRQVEGLEDVRVASTPTGPLTLTRVAGDNGIDVHLVLAEADRAAGEVLAAALPVVSGSAEAAASGAELLAGGDVDAWPGLSTVQAKRPSLSLSTVRFRVTSDHDLLEHADLFGLETVSRPDRGHFSRISAESLLVDQARQSAVAIFTATGFEAAAVTAIGMRLTSMPVYSAQAIRVAYERPFGFLSVHRDSGLVLFAGWVDSPDEFRRS